MTGASSPSPSNRSASSSRHRRVEPARRGQDHDRARSARHGEQLRRGSRPAGVKERTESRDDGVEAGRVAVGQPLAMADHLGDGQGVTAGRRHHLGRQRVPVRRVQPGCEQIDEVVDIIDGQRAEETEHTDATRSSSSRIRAAGGCRSIARLAMTHRIDVAGPADHVQQQGDGVVVEPVGVVDDGGDHAVATRRLRATRRGRRPTTPGGRRDRSPRGRATARASRAETSTSADTSIAAVTNDDSTPPPEPSRCGQAAYSSTRDHRVAIGQLGEQPRLPRAGLAVDPHDRHRLQEGGQLDARGRPSGPGGPGCGRRCPPRRRRRRGSARGREGLRRAAGRTRRAPVWPPRRHATPRCGDRRRREPSPVAASAAPGAAGPSLPGAAARCRRRHGRLRSPRRPTAPRRWPPAPPRRGGRHRPHLVGDVVEGATADSSEGLIDELGGRLRLERPRRGDRVRQSVDVDSAGVGVEPIAAAGPLDDVGYRACGAVGPPGCAPRRWPGSADPPTRGARAGRGQGPPRRGRRRRPAAGARRAHARAPVRPTHPLPRAPPEVAVRCPRAVRPVSGVANSMSERRSASTTDHQRRCPARPRGGPGAVPDRADPGPTGGRTPSVKPRRAAPGGRRTAMRGRRTAPHRRSLADVVSADRPPRSSRHAVSLPLETACAGADNESVTT